MSLDYRGTSASQMRKVSSLSSVSVNRYKLDITKSILCKWTIYCSTVILAVVPHRIPKTTKKPLSVRGEKNYTKTYSSSNATAPDLKKGCSEKKKRLMTVQFLKRKHKVVTSATDKRRMTKISCQTPR